ncbi:uncharacterized protein LOC121855066 [Homarus americanus]|uniref:Uncharacterized protein n=1 Tax=Homarus americanus TaxID=6706 RepID=A0A8J5ML02_HOMAM|nr:uncharacterized protein LOC121855066 [Homarus americanus]KAG7155408.1 hypothetical protein Hamer_G023694 [Homarus americanus]
MFRGGLVVFLLLLFLLPLQKTGATMTAVYHQMTINSYDRQCVEATVPLPTGLNLSPWLFCSRLCTNNPSCTAYCYSESACQLLNLIVAPDGYSSQGAVSSSAVSCYVPYSSPGPATTDLARGKPVTTEDTLILDYARGQTVVLGAKCEYTDLDCFCSTYQLTPYLIVNLETTQDVTTVVITASKNKYEDLGDLVVHVGNAGDDSDPVLSRYTGPAGPGEVVTLRGSSALPGRYVSLYKKSFLENALCLCLLQVYSA